MNLRTIPPSDEPWREPRTLACPRCSSPFVRILRTRHAGQERRRYVFCLTCFLRFRTRTPWVPGLHLDRLVYAQRAWKERPRRLAQLEGARLEARRHAIELMNTLRWRLFYWAKWCLKKVTNRVRKFLTSRALWQPQ